MKYYRISKDQSTKTEITYDDALNIVLGTFKDNDMTRDMLDVPNRIICRFSDVIVKSDDGMVLMAGYYNMMNDSFIYDDDGKRIGDAQ